MFIGFDDMPALFVPATLSAKMVGRLALKMRSYYDNFNATQCGLKDSDLDETVVVFFAKDKDELKRGLASGKPVDFRASGPVVLYSGDYDNGLPPKKSRIKAVGIVLSANIKAVRRAKGDVVSLKTISHGLTRNKLHRKGRFVTVVSQKAIADANLLVPTTGVSFMGANKFTTRDIASMLNHQRAVKPNTKDHGTGLSDVNWFFMKQRQARSLEKTGIHERFRYFEEMQKPLGGDDSDDFDD